MIAFGRPSFAYQSVSSTQTVALDLARQGFPAGTAVSARRQSAGRGRRGRVWHAPPDANVNLTVLGEAVAADVLWEIAPLVGIAVAEAVRAVAPDVDARVRFPNDVVVGGRKLAGVLVESARHGDGQIPLIGVGVNVADGAFAPDLKGRAVALAEVAGAPPTVDAVEQAVLERLSVLWDLWRGAGFAPIAARWNALRDPDAGRVFVVDGREEACAVLGIDAAGGVRIRTGAGVERVVAAASVILGNA